MSVLVIAEHENGLLKNAVYAVVAAVQALQTEVHVLVVASDEALTALNEQAALIDGVQKVIGVGAAHLESFLTEDVVAQIKVALAREAYTHVVMSSSYVGKRIVSYLAGQLGVDVTSDLTAFLAEDQFLRPVYAGSLLIVEELKGRPCLMSVRAKAFASAGLQGTPAAIISLKARPPQARVTLLEQCREEQASRPDLARANIVVGIGAGVSRSDLPLIETLADKLGAAIAATRLAVEAGMMPSNAMVGQTSRIIAPDLYIAIGIAGAVQHMAGVKDSRCIVAINNDANAPIFHNADYGIVADYRVVVPQMIEMIK